MSSVSKTINILGVTGSIGQSATDIILAQPEAFNVQVVTAHTDAQGLAEAAIKLKAKHAVLSNPENLDTLRDALSGYDVQVSGGAEALDEAAATPADVTLAAIVGMAGLKALMQAIEHSQAVAIANKEPLVAAGRLVMEAAQAHNTTLLPVDSEHNAIFQVFDFDRREDIERIILTASGGPFRTWTVEDMREATPQQALAHPNWSMGHKISIDSATMMNKALEVIEAHYLFDLELSKIEVLVHPQSVVHSMVEYKDGSVLAQMGPSDMRTPIANVLAWPQRLSTSGHTLDFKKVKELSFEEPDFERFPALKLAYECLEKGAWACVALNAANEVAVEYFLTNIIGFTDIIGSVMHVLEQSEPQTLSTIADVYEYDQYIRGMAKDYISDGTKKKAVVAS